MYLEDILITNEMRGKGIGKLLFDQLIEEARQRNLTALSGRCLTGTNRL
jgi:L-amino acid N-acyltransferase YncA